MLDLINSPARRRAVATVTGLVLVAGGSLVATAPTALAAKGGTCKGFTLTTAGKTYKGDRDFEIPANRVGSTIEIRGKYVEFTVDPATFGVRDYTLTGADSPRPDKNLPLDAPTVVFESKTPQGGFTLGGSIEVRLSTLR